MQDSVQNDDVLLDSVQVATLLGVSTHFVVKHSTGKKPRALSTSRSATELGSSQNQSENLLHRARRKVKRCPRPIKNVERGHRPTFQKLLTRLKLHHGELFPLPPAT